MASSTASAAPVNQICLRRLRDFQPLPGRLPSHLPHAAVLVGLFQDHKGELCVLLTKRSLGLRSHGGEVSFPGGKADPTDHSIVHTALREAHEEVGLPASAITILNTLQPLLSKHLLSVTPIVAWLGSSLALESLRINPTEVQFVFAAPLIAFLSEASHSSLDITFRTAPFRVHFFEHAVGRAQCFPPSAIAATSETVTVFGLTALILIQVASIAFNAPPPFALAPPNAPLFAEYTLDGENIVHEPKAVVKKSAL